HKKYHSNTHCGRPKFYTFLSFKNRPGYVLYPGLVHNDLQIILVTEILVHIDLNEAGIDLNASEGHIHWPMIPALFNSVSL
ncbi:hypothetical protein ABRT01_16520, partial [Lentibacillus sp. L22]|uniref:hypothetical protein n=1 Tax=Lentibacillus sp. L22 TaxID=3163028 RepID=UPI0034678F48